MANLRDGCGCKTGRITAEYGVPNVDTRLVERWQSETNGRRFTEELNEDIIESELDAANVGRVEWSRSLVYEPLRTVELSDAEAIEVGGNLIGPGSTSSSYRRRSTVFEGTRAV